MTVEYELTTEDIRRSSLYHNFHSPTIRRQYRSGLLVFPIMWLMICTMIWFFADRERHTPMRTFLDLWPLFSGVPLWFLYFPWHYRRKVRKIITAMINEGSNRGLLGRRQLTISPNGVTESGEFGQTTRTWKSIERIAEDEDYAYIYLHATEAMIVPRRAFGSNEEFGHFVAQAGEYHSAVEATSAALKRS
jgi:hypothetical protein